VGTREFFPESFSDAVRQKARWTLGIVFHGWQQRGWEGGVAMRYMIWRDRKTLMTNSVNMLRYALILTGIWSSWRARANGGSCVWLDAHSWIWKVILADTALLANRCIQRMIIVARIAGWKQAAPCLPRIVWANVINFFAVIKASSLFVRSAWLGRKLVWAKTEHAFPSEAELVGFKRKLGDLLLERRLISLSGLNQALARQKENGQRLGDIIVDLGLARERDVVETLGAQLKVETRILSPETVTPRGLAGISEHAAREHLIFAVEPDARPVVIAAADISDARMKRWLDANFPEAYRLVLAGRRNIVECIDRLTRSAGERDLRGPADKPDQGDLAQ
jgi:adsorption protein B